MDHKKKREGGEEGKEEQDQTLYEKITTQYI